MRSPASLVVIILGTLCVLSAQEKAETPAIDGKYNLVSGKKFGMAIDEDSRNAVVVISKDQVRLQSGEIRFVIAYKLKPNLKPLGISMEIVEGPEGTRGEKASGILEIRDDELKLAYTFANEKRPTNFQGQTGMLFVLKKRKGE